MDALSKLGTGIRPKLYRDVNHSKFRGVLFASAIAAVSIACSLLLVYELKNMREISDYLDGEGETLPLSDIEALSPNTVEMEAMTSKAKSLGAPAPPGGFPTPAPSGSGGAVSDLSCPCVTSVTGTGIERPFLKDLRHSGYKTKDGPRTCYAGTPLYARCLAHTPASDPPANTPDSAPEALDKLPRSCGSKWGGNYSENMCYALTERVATVWISTTMNPSKLMHLDFLQPAMVSSYYRECREQVKIQALGLKETVLTQVRLSLGSGSNQDKGKNSNFLTDTLLQYVLALHRNASLICGGRADAAPNSENELYDLLEGEAAEIQRWYVRTYFTSCAPTICSYKRQEGLIDIVLRVSTYASPVSFVCLTGASLFYFFSASRKGGLAPHPQAGKTATSSAHVTPVSVAGGGGDSGGGAQQQGSARAVWGKDNG